MITIVILVRVNDPWICFYQFTYLDLTEWVWPSAFLITFSPLTFWDINFICFQSERPIKISLQPNCFLRSSHSEKSTIWLIHSKGDTKYDTKNDKYCEVRRSGSEWYFTAIMIRPNHCKLLSNRKSQQPCFLLGQTFDIFDGFDNFL